MTFACPLTEEIAEEYWLGRLPRPKAAVLEAHLHECRACRMQWERVRNEIELIQSALLAWELSIWDRRLGLEETVEGATSCRLSSPKKAEALALDSRYESAARVVLTSGCRLRPGQTVQLNQGSTKRSAMVRYCRRLNGQFLIGLDLLTHGQPILDLGIWPAWVEPSMGVTADGYRGAQHLIYDLVR